MTAPGQDHRPAPRPPHPMRFVLVGVVLGFAVGGVLGLRGDAVPHYSPSTVALFLGAVFGVLGGVLGGLVYLAVDRRR